MKPLISYYGGKQRLASHIVEEINKIPHTVYGEPFCGGAAVLFAKPRTIVSNNNDYREFINDTSDLLINMYRIAVKCRDKFLLELQATLYSQSDHARAKEICKNPDEYDDLTKAWAYYVNIQMSFANTAHGGWRTSVITRNQAATWANQVRSLDEKLDRIRDVHVCNEDALRCIERFDSPHSLFYVDPPYPEADQGHYGGYTIDDWKALCELLDSIDGSYILSNYPQPIEPKSAQQRIEIDVVMSSSGQGQVGKKRDKSRRATKEELGDRKRTEVLWICDRSSKIRSELSFSKYRQTSLFEAV